METNARALYEHALRHAAWASRAQRAERGSLRIEALVKKIGSLLETLDPESEKDRRIAARLFEALALCEHARGTGPRPLVLDLLHHPRGGSNLRSSFDPERFRSTMKVDARTFARGGV